MLPQEAIQEFALRGFHAKRALKVIAGLQNFDAQKVAAVVTAAEKGGATHVDIACDAALLKLATSLTILPVCVSSVVTEDFVAAVEAGAHMQICEKVPSILGDFANNSIVGSMIFKAITPPPGEALNTDGGIKVTAPRIEMRDGRYLAYREI